MRRPKKPKEPTPREQLKHALDYDFHGAVYLIAEHGFMPGLEVHSLRAVGEALLTMLGIEQIEARCILDEFACRHGLDGPTRTRMVAAFDEWVASLPLSSEPEDITQAKRRNAWHRWRDLPTALTGREYDVSHLAPDGTEDAQPPPSERRPSEHRALPSEPPPLKRATAQVIDLAAYRQQRQARAHA